MKYGLYENAKNSSVVEELINQAILTFVLAIKDLSKTYKGTGVTDTASKEAIAAAVSDALFDEL